RLFVGLGHYSGGDNALERVRPALQKVQEPLAYRSGLAVQILDERHERASTVLVDMQLVRRADQFHRIVRPLRSGELVGAGEVDPGRLRVLVKSAPLELQGQG